MATQSVGIATEAKKRRQGGALREEAIWGWLLQIPNVLGLSIFFVGPLIVSFVMIFTHWEIITPPTWAGLDNFNTLFNDPLFATALANTAYVTLISVPLYLILALLLAVALNQKLRGINI